VDVGAGMPKPAVPARRDPPPVAAADIERGDALTLMSRAGPVRIERKVVAMQPGRHGRRLFVRDEDGAVSSIPLHVRPEAKR
jgi:hypothetical protein